MKHLATIFLLLCLGATTLQAQQAIINEFSSDPTAWDGSGGEFIELYCPLGGGDCDISCWIVSDAQGLIKISRKYNYC